MDHQRIGDLHEAAELIRPGLEVTPSRRPTGALGPRFADALAHAGGRIGGSETRQIAGRLFGERTSGLVPLRTAAVGAELDEMILAIDRAEGTGWSAPRLPAWLRRR
ncbi:MAG TPA: hypothetical protein QGF58_30755 [Myxococcota bacterium]|nr:hypothetical protein [Myxococcota bacterium]